MREATSLKAAVGAVAACKGLQISRSTFYRHYKPCISNAGNKSRPAPPLALKAEEKQKVIDLLHSSQFVDMAPHEVYATLLDDGIYHCSIRTMYRYLKQVHGHVKERRRQVQRPNYKKPELLATTPNELWSWDITKLKSVNKWTCFYLYVIIDVFSRYIVGWMVAYSEQTALAKRLIKQPCIKQEIQPDQLTIHADRGSSMKSKGVADLLVDLKVMKTHSRPHVSNDNPYSESNFKTLKYCPQFPGMFGSIEDARLFCRDFINWYNRGHHHSDIGLVTPEQVHYNLSQKIYDNRTNVLLKAFGKHPKRFKGKMPLPPEIPQEAWINKPKFESSQVLLS
jgi:putative transposase